MHPRFAKATNSLDASYKALVKMKPVTIGSMPKEMPARGIYLFSEEKKHLYIGRSNKLHKEASPALWNASDGSICISIGSRGYGFRKAELQKRR